MNTEQLRSLINTGNKLKSENKLEDAIEKYTEALSINPNCIPALNRLAEIYQYKKQYSEELGYREHVVKLQPDNSVVRVRLATVYLMQGRTEEATSIYQNAMADNPQLPIWVYNQLGNALVQKNRVNEAITIYEKAIELYPDNFRLYLHIAPLYTQTSDLDSAIESYQQAIYQNAMADNPQLPIWAYNQLGNALVQQDRVNEAIAIYEKAIELYPDDCNLYQKVATLYTQVGNLDSAIESYQQAIKLKPDLPFHTYGTLAKALKQQGREEEAANLLNSSKEGKEGETYLKIWNAFNQTSLETLENESSQYPTEIDENAVRQYFTQTSQYKIINLTSMSDEDRGFIETAGLSLNYLNQNQKLVTAAGVWEEDTTEEEHLLLQQLAAKEGCFSAICPSTGQLLQSNRSILVSGLIFYYRFVGHEVFYLIIGGNEFQKDAIYFPRLELIIQLKSTERLSLHIGNALSTAQKTTPLKVVLVNNWQIMKQYLSNVEPAQKCSLVGINFSTGHHLCNELSGIQKAWELGFVQQIDKFLAIGPEYYGGIDEIFPEIPLDKVERFNYWQTTQSTSWKTRHLVHAEASKEILKNNYFAFKLGDYYRVSDDLRDRLHQASLKKCSPDCLAAIEAAKKNYFPLFWVSFRTHFRIWISQVEGIANIVKGLADDFPNLAVVFDGYTRIDIGGNLLISQKDEEIIKTEKDVASQIQSLFPPNIKAYHIIGSPMYEVLVWAHAIDLYLVPGGSGQVKVKNAVSKPGFIHSNKTIRNNLSENEIVDLPQQGEGVSINYSYDFDWKIAYKRLLEIASSLETDR